MVPQGNIPENENSPHPKIFKISDVSTEAEALFSQDEVKTNPLFKIQPANQWLAEANARPIPKMLFSEFWFEGELCILFADANLGKSILAVQIGNSISQGENIVGFKSESPPQSVLYFDFELADKQFETRYSNNYTKHYSFSPNFKRAEINTDATIPDGYTNYEDYLYVAFEQAIITECAKVLIIDNLTFLKNDTEKAKDALPLMKHLKALKSKHGLSILALAHIPKRDLTKPITRNDLQGSKMLINFCDSAFTMGESTRDKTLRYLKQIKQRNTESLFDADNVCICQICKPDNFLMFEFKGYCTEREHLKQLTENDRAVTIEKAKELSKKGYSQRQIATELCISVGAVNKYLKQ